VYSLAKGARPPDAGPKCAGQQPGTVFWGLGLDSAQSQAAAGMLLRQSLGNTSKTPAPNGYSISSNALGE